MKKELLETIELVNKINAFINQKDSKFDAADVLGTLEDSRNRLFNFISELKNIDADNKAEVNKLLVHIELEYANFVWAFQEMRDFINRTLVKYPD